jgi:hypothetical protein
MDGKTYNFKETLMENAGMRIEVKKDPTVHSKFPWVARYYRDPRVLLFGKTKTALMKELKAMGFKESNRW